MAHMKRFSHKTSMRVGYRQPLRPGQSAVTHSGFIFNKTPAGTVRNRVLRANQFILMYIQEGMGTYDDQLIGARRLNAGDVVIHMPGVRHTYGPDPLWSEAYLGLEGELFARLEAEGLISRASPVLSPGLVPALLSSFNSLVDDFIKEQRVANAIHTARVHLLLAQIADLHHAAEAARRGDNFLRRACALLEENLEREIDMDGVAEQFNFGYERFRKLFAEQTGVSPARYRILRRIDRAKSLLTEGRVPLKAVAEQLGYCDVYFFARQFKQLTGRTPGQFRET